MITLRPITENDAEAFLQLRHKLDHETKFMMLEPGERATPLEQVQQQLQNVVKAPNKAIFVLEDEGPLVGYLSIMGEEFRRNRHCAYIVIGILQAYTGQGLGKRLFTEMEKWAKQTGLHRLELTVMAHNLAGVALYQKMGFEIEGTKHDSLLVDGRYIDEYYMAKLI
jgi:RimJ/RimL family protein N-acetyltransferase